MTGRVVDV